MKIRFLLGSLDSPGCGRFSTGSSEHVRYLIGILRTEVFEFFLPYPIELVPEAGPRNSLHYYVYSEKLFFDAMRLDDRGVPFQRSLALGSFYNPAYIAWYGLMAMEQSLNRGRVRDSRFDIQVQWLVRNAVRQDDASVVWPFPIDVREGRCTLRAPWVSAMSQGLAISALVRAHRIEPNEPVFIELCRRGVDVFEKPITEGGLRTSQEDGHTLYEEYPAYPLPRVLDGFLFSLLGLYDLWIETGDPVVKERLDEGVEGLTKTIDDWNFKNCWTWYGTHGYLSPRHYHDLNRHLLAAVANVTGNTIPARYSELWDPQKLDPIGWVALFLMFFLLKQKSRFRSLLKKLRVI